MALVTETFEGYYDYHTGWEFDMPVVMVKPRFHFGIAGSAGGGIENAIENYMIDYPHFPPLCESAMRERKACLPVFYRARRDPRVRKGATYWKQVVCWDTETLESEVLESINC